MNVSNLIIYIKYIVAIILVVAVFCAPAYLAGQTGRDKTDMTKIRVGSWLLGWSIIGWLWALFKASKK
ncbi:MAG: hypothetical protein IJ866_02395 [Alphaproteobacteria bacterium]|nr:hypothetical protein [Alphaproteobacteria bacterium]